jgi:hypothetical protein
LSYEEYEQLAASYAAGEVGRRKFLQLLVAGGIGFGAAVAAANALSPAWAAPPHGTEYGTVYGTPPGLGGTPPGQGGVPPGQGGWVPPGRGGVPPGQGGSGPPGQRP